ncbi:MAG: SpoIIE family protein phosphatase [Ruminococcus sp.]|nr:SpoIIE family protein phosphatase [Ruminococcus sp.]
MRKSIFFKLALIIIPIVLVLELVEVYVVYHSVYTDSYETCTKATERAAEVASEMFRYYNPDSNKNDPTYWDFSDDFSDICEMIGVTYIFAVEPDVETRSEKYLAIGFGENASEDAKKTRYPGVVVKGTLTDDEIEAVNGGDYGKVIREKNQFDETLIYYMPVKKLYDYDKGTLKEPDKKIIIGAEMSLSKVNEVFRERFIWTALDNLIHVFIIISAIFLILHFRINGPIKKISGRMKSFVSDREKGFVKLEVKGKDELAEMSRSFNTMAEEIDNYITDIDRLNKEKHTQEAELDIARSIQTGLLKPNLYENDKIRINACMHAAKNVGGDLYEYHVLDDGRVFIAVADVSGKGISAALFMSCAITLLRQLAAADLSPAKILSVYNNTLRAQNPKRLFITTFAAVFDPKTGSLTYSNAGHNRPYIVSDSLIKLEGAAGVAAGVFGGCEFKEETVIMKPGDVLFVYTDGVNEAEDPKRDMFGTEALEDELSRHIGTDKRSIADDMLRAVSEFSGEADQSDDITVLTMDYLG